VSKYGVEGLSLLLAEELANTSNIRVNCVNPGATRTMMRAKAYPAEDPANVTTPQELMPLFLYLMGIDSKGTTGQSIDAQQK
jgi:NAD(P)-dependent dehydrogenase (short-subunit alcohol dehydrogenase family)